VDTNRVATAGLFEPIEDANIVTAVASKVAGIMVDIDKFNTFGQVFPQFYRGNGDINTGTPLISLRRLSYIIYPQLDKSSLLY
jgi:hypothetical protein